MNTVIILSGGTGSRLGGDIPKQYLRAGKYMMITETILAVAGCKDVEAIRIVCDEKWQQAVTDDLAAAEKETGNGRAGALLTGFSKPGANRQLSALNGMRDTAADAKTIEDDIVIIHDAARPLVKPGTISDIIAACSDHDGAMPVLPMKDTVYLSDDGKSVSSLIDRSRVFAGQAPEAFRLEKYLRANEALLPDRIMLINGASEPAILAGLDIAMITGDEGNYKITTASDLERYRAGMKQTANMIR